MKEVKDLFIYAIDCLSLPNFHKYDQYIILFCVDTLGKTCIVQVDQESYKPFLLLQQQKTDQSEEITEHTDLDNLQDFAETLDKDLCYGQGNLTFAEKQMTPLVGWCNNRKDRILRLSYTRLSNGWRLRKHLKTFGLALDPVLTEKRRERCSKWNKKKDDEEEENDFKHINPKCVLLHDSVKDVNLFLHQTGIHLQTWIRIDVENVDFSKKIVNADMFIDNICPYSNIKLLTNEELQQAKLPAIGQLLLCFLRVVGKSSTANSTNMFNADANIPQDTIRFISIEIVNTTDASKSRSLKISIDEDYVSVPLWTPLQRERHLLGQIKILLEQENPHVLVQCSDTHCDIAFLQKRTIHHDKLDINLSMIRNLPVRQVIFQDKLFDITHHGRLRLDIRHALIKFYISPPMDGFTLIDGHSHPKLLKVKPPLPDSSIINPLSTSSAVMTRVLQEMQVLIALTIDNNFLGNNLALSKSCDMVLTAIIERGQQKRVANVFYKRYYNENIYVNHQQLDHPFVVVKRHRSKSSYPDPEWLKNPPLHSLRKTSSPLTPLFNPSTKNKKRIISVLDLIGKSKLLPVAKKRCVRYTGGFVVPPEPLFYKRPEHAVATLDFASLYPSVIEGSSICYSRVLYDRNWLDKLPETSLQFIPMDDEHCAVFVLFGPDGKPVRSITDKIAAEVVKNRKMIRAEMKIISKQLMTATDDERDIINFTLVSMDAAQLSAKVLQNALYGFLGSDTSGMLCTALAAAVTCISAVQNKQMRHFVIGEMNARVVYGDTDSVMVQFPTDPNKHITRDEILSEITRQALEAEHKSMKMFPFPNKVEFESLKSPMLLTSKKKTYGAIEFGPEPMAWKKPGVLLCKGFVFKKRSACETVQKAGKTAFNYLLADDEKSVAETVQICVDSINFKPNNIYRFIITCKLNDCYKSKDIIALKLASMIEEDTGVRPLPGRRLPFLVAFFDDKRLHCCRVVTPERFTRDNMSIDIEYYLKKQLFGSFKQLLDLHPLLLRKIEFIIDRRVSKLQHTRTGQRTLR